SGSARVHAAAGPDGRPIRGDGGRHGGRGGAAAGQGRDVRRRRARGPAPHRPRPEDGRGALGEAALQHGDRRTPRRVRGVLGHAGAGGRARARPGLMRNVQVHKFGGASLADAPAFAHAVRIIGQQTGKLVVVVSAMSGTTDLLLEGAEKARVGDPKPLAAIADRLRKKHVDAARVLVAAGPVLDAILSVIDASMTELATLAQGIAIVRELTPRTKDELVARGERLSAHLFSAALHATGHAAAYVDALQVIRTDGQFGNAAPDLKATDVATRRVILPLFKANTIPVVPGFFGATPDGQLATLGRGGTDVTAVLLGRALGAREVSL